MASGMIRLYTQQFVRFVPLVAQKHKLITIFLLHFSRKQRNFMFCEACSRTVEPTQRFRLLKCHFGGKKYEAVIG